MKRCLIAARFLRAQKVRAGFQNAVNIYLLFFPQFFFLVFRNVFDQQCFDIQNHWHDCFPALIFLFRPDQHEYVGTSLMSAMNCLVGFGDSFKWNFYISFKGKNKTKIKMLGAS